MLTDLALHGKGFMSVPAFKWTSISWDNFKSCVSHSWQYYEIVARNTLHNMSYGTKQLRHCLLVICIFFHVFFLVSARVHRPTISHEITLYSVVISVSSWFTCRHVNLNVLLFVDTFYTLLIHIVLLSISYKPWQSFGTALQPWPLIIVENTLLYAISVFISVSSCFSCMSTWTVCFS